MEAADGQINTVYYTMISSIRHISHSGGWSGGAMGLGKLLVSRRPTIWIQ